MLNVFVLPVRDFYCRKPTIILSEVIFSNPVLALAEFGYVNPAKSSPDWIMKIKIQ